MSALVLQTTDDDVSELLMQCVAEVEVLGGGVPTLLRTSEFLLRRGLYNYVDCAVS